MLKYILLSIFCIGCAEAKPMYIKLQAVMYQVPNFYSKVCSGVGSIFDFEWRTGKIIYTIKTPREEIDCPLLIEIPETAIIPI